MFEDIYDELMEYWHKATDSEKYDEITFRRKTRTQKIQKAKRKKIATRQAPNWKSLKPKKGYKRVKVGNRYVRVRMSGKEKQTRKRVAKQLGKKTFRKI